MTKHRSYLVCKCGSWVFQDRVASGRVTHCQQCWQKWKLPPGVPKPGPQTPPRTPKPTRRQGSPLHSPPQITPSPPEKPGRKQFLRTVWDAIPAEAQEKLRAAGWREAKPDAEEVASPLDPLLQVMLANKDNLPEAVKEAFEEATAEPTVAPSVKGAQFSRKLSSATSRLRNLVKKQLSLQTQITDTKEAMQDTTKAIAESQAKVDEAKKDLAAMLEAPENQDHSSMEVEEMVKQLGVELSEAQRTKLQELRSAKRARVENPAETFEAPPGLGTEAPQGQPGTEQGGQQGSQNARAGVRSRSRGRATE